MPQPTVRVGGSGLTTFKWKGQTLAFLQTIQDTAPTPVAAAVPVQSITDAHPSEIVTSQAVGPGTLRLTFYDVWNEEVWQKLAGFNTSYSLLDVLSNQLKNGVVTCSKLIAIPPPRGGFRVKNYYNCMITDIDAGEQINIASMVMPKGLTIMYTHSGRG